MNVSVAVVLAHRVVTGRVLAAGRAQGLGVTARVLAIVTHAAVTVNAAVNAAGPLSASHSAVQSTLQKTKHSK